MALRAALLKSSWGKGECAFRDFRRWAHASAQSAPLQNAIDIASQPPLVSPGNEDNINVDFPNFPFLVGFMDLMAVPKRKTSPHKRGIRNGPKALKPVPVIVRCRACGRVKLPHFFCCSGIKPNPGEYNG